MLHLELSTLHTLQILFSPFWPHQSPGHYTKKCLWGGLRATLIHGSRSIHLKDHLFVRFFIYLMYMCSLSSWTMKERIRCHYRGLRATMCYELAYGCCIHVYMYTCVWCVTTCCVSIQPFNIYRGPLTRSCGTVGMSFPKSEKRNICKQNRTELTAQKCIHANPVWFEMPLIGVTYKL